MKYSRVAAGVAALVTCGLNVWAPARAADAPPRETSYGPDPADVLLTFAPATPEPHKLVLWVHGGSWVTGNARGTKVIAEPLNAAGYTVVGVGYRLVPQTDVAGEAGDVAHAAAYVLTHAGEFGIDPNRFALIGHSSGAHLVALLGTDASYLRAAGVAPGKLAAVITLDGVYDLRTQITHFPHLIPPEVFGADPAVWARYSPVTYVASMTSPPVFCVLHEDKLQRFIEQAGIFESALQAHHDPVMTAVAPGLNHGQLVKYFDDARQPMGAFAVGCLKKAR